jgi:hypothetical protein
MPAFFVSEYVRKIRQATGRATIASASLRITSITHLKGRTSPKFAKPLASSPIVTMFRTWREKAGIERSSPYRAFAGGPKASKSEDGFERTGCNGFPIACHRPARPCEASASGEPFQRGSITVQDGSGLQSASAGPIAEKTPPSFRLRPQSQCFPEVVY